MSVVYELFAEHGRKKTVADPKMSPATVCRGTTLLLSYYFHRNLQAAEAQAQETVKLSISGMT